MADESFIGFGIRETRHDQHGNVIPPPLSHNDIVAGFIVNGILSGRYTSYPDHQDIPDGDLSILLLTLWGTLERRYGDEILHHVLSYFRPPRTENEEMKSVFQGLAKFSGSMGLGLGSAHLDYPMRSRIPPMDSTIHHLLKQPPFLPFGDVDAKVLAMARWFKNGYMSWIDPIKCPSCGGATQSVGNAKPEPKEFADGAGRVELHLCAQGCGGKRRFARYNNISTLVQTKEGRCGEWAHLFYAFLRVSGVKARYIWNSEDHVWNEYWSPTLEHWVHVDSCEGVTNKPLLYDRGWGKKQAFCLAFGPGGAEDVTRVYVSDWRRECQSRRRAKRWDEKELRRRLVEHTIRLRIRMDRVTRQEFKRIDECQAAWVADEKRRQEEAEKDELGGRTSGTADWRARRHELGLATVSKPSYRVKTSYQPESSELQLFGQVRLAEGGITLTSGPGESSAIFSPTALKSTDNFRVEFTFRITAPDGCGEADGLAVVFAREKGLGLGGFGLGYSGLGGRGDFAIEIDTYLTRDHADDPPTPHISLHSPPDAHHQHSISCTAPGSLPHLSDGRDYALEIFYQAQSRRLRGYLNWTDEGERIEVGVCDVSIPMGEEGVEGSNQWFVGLTGSCGGLWQKQDILEWSVEEIDYVESEEVGTPDEASTFPPGEGKPQFFAYNI